jgi:hypothetical protein
MDARVVTPVANNIFHSHFPDDFPIHQIACICIQKKNILQRHFDNRYMVFGSSYSTSTLFCSAGQIASFFTGISLDNTNSVFSCFHLGAPENHQGSRCCF